MENAITEEGKWEVLDSEYLFRRPWLTVRHDTVRLPDGRINPEYYVLEYPDWINVLAITEDGKFVLERQYRHGLGKTCYEIPAGVIEKGETPLEAARRELQEETGIKADIKDLHLLGIYSDPKRDSRGHTVSAVYVYFSDKEAHAADDARDAKYFHIDNLPEKIAFDHRKILQDAKEKFIK